MHKHKQVGNKGLTDWVLYGKEVELDTMEGKDHYFTEVKSDCEGYEVFLNFEKNLTNPDLSELKEPVSVTVLDTKNFITKNFKVKKEVVYTC